MAASASYSVNSSDHRHRYHHHHHQEQEQVRGDSPCSGNSWMFMERTCSALKHDPGLSIYWSTEEQNILEEGLARYVCESGVSQYAKIAMQLDNKTVRDVALRCRWMTKKEIGKRRKEDHYLARKMKEKKEKLDEHSLMSIVPASMESMPPHDSPLVHLEYDAISYGAVGGVAGDLLQRNAQVFTHIYENLSARRVQENIALFCLTLNNMHSILNSLKDTSDVMKQMPALPVKLNEELASTILPLASILMNS